MACDADVSCALRASESGSFAAFNGPSNTDNVGHSTLGARAATSYLMPNGMVLTPRVSAA